MAYKSSPFIKDGEFTTTIYTMIKESRFADAIRVLRYELHRNPDSRAGLSLLGFCYYGVQEYVLAAECYERLAELFPENTEYRLNHAQSLYNAFMFPEAVNTLAQINDQKMEKHVVKLEAAIKYREEDYQNAHILVDQFSPDDPDGEVNRACLEFKERKYEEALKRFTGATRIQLPDETSGAASQNDLTYAIALCHYHLDDYESALKMIVEIVDRAMKDFPELGIGSAIEGGLEPPPRSLGSNAFALNESLIIEACNLKFAIEYKIGNTEAAAEALKDMPPRSEEELDPVTLHNQAIIGVDSNPADSFAKLQYLLGQNPFPPETFANLLLLYCKYEYYDLTADVLAENASLTYKYLEQYMYDYFDALITLQTSDVDAYNKLEKLAENQANIMRKKYQHLMQLRQSPNSKTLHKALDEFERELGRYLPLLMMQAKIFWDKGNYARVEQLFRRSAEFCSENHTWKMNLAHTLFMQEKFRDASDCYAPIVSKSFKKLLNVSAVVLANVCVCYIMTNNNEEAEELLRKVEQEESMLLDAGEKSFHLSIINLVIGTLYCSKGNYEFGISRIVRALEPCEKKLGIDTWFYAKRCLISMLQNIAKCIIFVSDEVLDECLQFLELCEIHGHEISTESNVFAPPSHRITDLQKTVAKEARILKALLLRIME